MFDLLGDGDIFAEKRCIGRLEREYDFGYHYTLTLNEALSIELTAMLMVWLLSYIGGGCHVECNDSNIVILYKDTKGG